MSRAHLPRGVFTRDDWPKVEGALGRKRRLSGSVTELAADAVIVGSGAGGAVVAAELAEGGLDVLVLEEGGYHPTEEFKPKAAEMVRKLYRDGGMDMALGAPPVIFTEGRCVGGSTTINGGMTFRTPEKILYRWQQENGLQHASPTQMEPYFQRVEKFISAAPNDKHTVGRDNKLLRQGAKKKGWEVVDNIRNHKHCSGANNCAFGCPNGAKQSTLVSYLPRALHFGARIYADCRVGRILRKGNRAIGVAGRVIDATGTPSHKFIVRAPLVFVAAGAIQSPALLLRSGIRTPSGQIGHNLAMHPNAKQVAIFDEPIHGYKGAHQVYQVREFQPEGFVMAAVNIPPALLAMTLPSYGEELGQIMRKYNNIITAGVLVEDSVFGRVRMVPGGHPVVHYQLSNRDAQLIVRSTALLAELLFEVGARRIILPFDGMPDLMNADDARQLLRAPVKKSSMELLSMHLMCTARMGADEKRHVCDSWGAVHGQRGLWVTDASSFPSPIGVNPMETVMALATRNAARVLETNALRTATQHA